jgi:hypothetical protein
MLHSYIRYLGGINSSGCKHACSDESKAKKKNYVCKHDECTKGAVSGGVCVNHGGKKKKYVCKHDECTKWAISGGVCADHGGERKKYVFSHEQNERYLAD